MNHSPRPGGYRRTAGSWLVGVAASPGVAKAPPPGGCHPAWSSASPPALPFSPAERCGERTQSTSLVRTPNVVAALEQPIARREASDDDDVRMNLGRNGGGHFREDFLGGDFFE